MRFSKHILTAVYILVALMIILTMVITFVIPSR